MTNQPFRPEVKLASLLLGKLLPAAALVVSLLGLGSSAEAAKKTVWVKKGTMVVALRDAAVRTRPDAEAPELYTVVEGERLQVVGASGRGAWIRVNDAEGTPGWIRTRHIAVARGQGRLVFGADGVAGDEGRAGGEEVSFQRNPSGESALGLRAGVGVLMHRQSFTSNGSGIFGKYLMTQTSPTLSAQVGGARRVGGFVVGASGQVLTTMGGSGVQVASTMGSDTLAWRRLEIGVDALAGLPIGKDMLVTASVGYFSANTRVEASPQAKLPSENLSGIRVGGELLMPHVGGSDLWGIGLGVSGLLGAKFSQSQGMREGTQSRATAIGGHAALSRKLSGKATLVARYDLTLQRMTFGGTNERDAAATGGSRKDYTHAMTLGLEFGF